MELNGRPSLGTQCCPARGNRWGGGGRHALPAGRSLGAGSCVPQTPPQQRRRQLHGVGSGLSLPREMEESIGCLAEECDSEMPDSCGHIKDKTCREGPQVPYVGTDGWKITDRQQRSGPGQGRVS